LQPGPLIVSFVWLFALALTAWILASWYWRLNGTPVQSARPTPVSDPVIAAQDIASRQLFGVPASQTIIANAAPVSDLVVVGVTTRWGKLPGFAVIKNGSAAVASYVEGEEISPGIKLVRVRPDSIEIDRNGTREQIGMNAVSSTQPSPDASLNKSSQAPATLSPNPPANASPPAADN
jgi:type II secretory pathway component PulC